MVRIIKPRFIRKVFKIFVEGEITEKEYFSGIKNYISNKSDKKPTNIQVTIIHWWNNSELIKKVIRAKEKDIDDFIYYAVIDRDNLTQKTLNKIKDDCKKYGVILIFSNKCFELWILLHFECRKKEVAKINDYSDYLNKNYFNGKLKKERGSIEKLFPEIIKWIEVAISNSKLLRAMHKKSGAEDFISCNIQPFTNVDEIIIWLFKEFWII